MSQAISLMLIRKGISRPFRELLRIMQSSKHAECMELAKQICSEVNTDDNNDCTSSEIMPAVKQFSSEGENTESKSGENF